MPTARSHDREYIEPERHDELSAGVPASVVPVDAGARKRSRGRFTPASADTAAAAKRGGESRKGTTLLSHHIEGPKLTGESVRRARTLRRALSGEIALTVGGGHCGIASSLFVKFAAQKTAAAEEAFARGDYETHRKLSESARMDVLYAREHAAKEAVARKSTGGGSAFADILAALPSGPAKGNGSR